jgi:hypothetical protein
MPLDVLKAPDLALYELDRYGHLDRQQDGHWASEWRTGRSYSNRTINRLIEQRKIKRLGDRVVKQEAEDDPPSTIG